MTKHSTIEALIAEGVQIDKDPANYLPYPKIRAACQSYLDRISFS